MLSRLLQQSENSVIGLIICATFIADLVALWLLLAK